MAGDAAYLVRGDNGQMATIMARSIRGALRSYMLQYHPDRGDVVNVKKRGEGDWQSFKISYG